MESGFDYFIDEKYPRDVIEKQEKLRGSGNETDR